MSQLFFGIVPDVPPPLRVGVARLHEELGVPVAFRPRAEAEAEAAASRAGLPDVDRTEIEFVTIDPAGSTDLDQALHLERAGTGYRVRYAIADVADFVRPGGALDAECHSRGVTLYAPTHRTPLHPPVLSENAASLLPGQSRPALLWEIDLDAAGEITAAHVARATVSSREQLTYEGVQAALDAGTASESLRLLEEVGRLRQAREIDRGGVSLQTPEQEVVADGEDWRLVYRTTLPVEDWNAQISLLTGMAGARLMLDAGVGILRTLPPAVDADVQRLRRTARALGLDWPGSTSYPDFVRSLDPALPAHAAMLTACTRLFRGAGYVAFDGELPAQPLHAALATEYAHCTAPLRRLADRYAGEVCLAVCAGRPVPGWVRGMLARLPDEMAAADSRAKRYERGIVDLVEALVLRAHVGQTFTGTVIEADPKGGGGVVQLASPAVEAKVRGAVTLGESACVRVDSVDLAAGKVVFQAV